MNRADDVKLVQRLLNGALHLLIPLRPLGDDGRCGPTTIGAIEAFQSRVSRNARPDGRVDPNGGTFRDLLAKGVAWTPLPRAEAGYYLYTTSDKTFGSAATVASIKELVRRFAHACGSPALVPLGIGDLSHNSGGPIQGHASHQYGTDVDIRPVRNDSKQMPVTIQDPNYDRERTRKLVECLRKDANLDLILFNDTSIAGVRQWQGHDNHLHVRFKS